MQKPTFLISLRRLTVVIIALVSFVPIAYAENYRLDILAEDLDYPWSLDFLPNGDLLLTELSGSLRHLSKDGDLSAPIANVPEVFRASQGGLFDVLVDPNFSQNLTSTSEKNNR